MQALTTLPGRPGSATVAETPAPTLPAGGVPIRVLEVGVCGTDREIVAGEFGTAPPGDETLILGHELLGEVAADGHGFDKGDLVSATVRRSCERCAPCLEGSPDACATGDYAERGITALHGFAAEAVVEWPEHIVAVPRALGRLGVLAEPASICARGLRHALTVGARQPWEARRALVIGAGAIGMLAAYMLRLANREVVVAARSATDSEKAALAAAAGAEYLSTAETRLEDTGAFDLVIEAAGSAELMVAGASLLRRNGVVCLLGLDAHAHPVTIDGTLLGVDFVIENRVLLGSVNAHRRDWDAGVRDLVAMRERWPDALERLIGLRVAPDGFPEAFAFRGVKATLQFV
ncbi:MAG TPA: alcohol dehydrogenase catalytic domain-containing protein [Solirubrobacteraceae bacterium]|nr:alcohol dehydrogenase catalytic domain-containing protein [Solirubrobacteraceae bacterium]